MKKKEIRIRMDDEGADIAIRGLTRAEVCDLLISAEAHELQLLANETGYPVEVLKQSAIRNLDILLPDEDTTKEKEK